MGLLARLASWVDPTAQWVADYRLRLVFDFDTHSLCGVPIGASVDDLQKLGRAEDWRAARQGLLCYYSKGFEVETCETKITAYALVFNSAPWISPRHQLFRGVSRVNGESVILNGSTCEQKVVEVLGKADDREEDDEEIVLFYERDGLKWELEFALQKQLREFIIMSPPVTPDAAQRRKYA